MANTTLPCFADVQRSYTDGPAATARPDERNHLLRYLRQHGALIATADDLFHAVLTLNGEDELSAFRCEEGTAVSHASDGWWLLFRSGEPLALDPVTTFASGDAR